MQKFINQIRKYFDTTTFDDLGADEYKDQTKSNWTNVPCGSDAASSTRFTQEYFDEIEDYRYSTHPWIKNAIHGFDINEKDVLEIGYGMGTDHINLAKMGGRMHGIDLTPRNFEETSTRFNLLSYQSELKIGDAENLPYDDNTFDFIYSFGVIHHSPNTTKIVKEIHRVLKPGGACWVSVYHKNSIFFWWSVYLWNYLIKGGFRKFTLQQQLSLVEYPNDNPNMVIRLYKKDEFAKLFTLFNKVTSTIDHLLVTDIALFSNIWPKPEKPRKLTNLLGKRYGWYVIVEAEK